jgi:hypothetical protein
MERLPDHDDRALAVRSDHRDTAGMRRATSDRVDLRPRARQLGGDLRRGLVVAEGGEEVHLGVAARELGEGDAAASSREPAGIREVHDLARTGHRRDASDGDVLDVTDDGDPGRPPRGAASFAHRALLLAGSVPRAEAVLH